MKINKFFLLVPALAGLLAARPASAQPLTLTGTNYYQSFDTITGGGLPSEWSVREGNVNTTSLGNLVAFNTDSGTDVWSTNSGKFYDLAGASNNGTVFVGTESAAIQNAATNRCVAVRVTAAFGDTNATGGVAFALEIASTTNLGSFGIDLDFLLLNIQGRSNIWTVEYGLGNSPTSFTSVGSYTALSSNAPAGVFGATHKSFSFGTALDNQPGPVWIRIADDTLITSPLNSGGSGSRPMVGIDNVNLSWAAVAPVTNPAVITSQPASVTNNAGDNAILTVGATGTQIGYQWSEVVGGSTNALSNGQNPDGSTYAGVTGPTLQIEGVLGAEAGTYVVTITNSQNTTNSALATLTVNDPIISIQPLSSTNVAGDITYFAATAIGSEPMDVKWFYNNTLVTDLSTNGNTNEVFLYITNSTAWTNLIGFYMVASNSFNTAISSNATSSLPLVPPGLITRWDFDETNTYPVTAPLASSGTGTGSQVTSGGIYTNFLFPPGAIADPLNFTVGVVNSGWEFQDGPTNGTANKQVGFQYNTSTAGWRSIYLTWQERHSATASKYMRVQYSPDSTNFFDGPVVTFNDVGYDFYSVNLNGYPGINNNPNFAFRVVCEFESTAIGSTNAAYDGATGTYNAGVSGGTIRNDLMTVWGIPILHITPIGANAYLSWASANFALQSATNVTGPYTNTPVNPAGPSYSTPFGKQMFFRLTY